LRLKTLDRRSRTYAGRPDEPEIGSVGPEGAGRAVVCPNRREGGLENEIEDEFLDHLEVEVDASFGCA
jgi:hypothetical protein